jgi:hypothetical protein
MVTTNRGGALPDGRRSHIKVTSPSPGSGVPWLHQIFHNEQGPHSALITLTP